MVWAETVRIMHDLFENVWKNGDEIVVDHAVDVTFAVRGPISIAAIACLLILL